MVLIDILSAIEMNKRSSEQTSVHSFQRERTSAQTTDTPSRRRHSNTPTNSHNNSTHGDPLGVKDNNDARFIFENWDGLAPWKPRNDKIVVARNLVHRLQGDAYLGVECRANWGMLPQPNHLNKIFKTESGIKSIAAYNKHEHISRAQEGGTAIVTHDHLATQLSLIHI